MCPITLALLPVNIFSQYGIQLKCRSYTPQSVTSHHWTFWNCPQAVSILPHWQNRMHFCWKRKIPDTHGHLQSPFWGWSLAPSFSYLTCSPLAMSIRINCNGILFHRYVDDTQLYIKTNTLLHMLCHHSHLLNSVILHPITNLSARFDPELTFEAHIKCLCKISFQHLINIAKFSPILALSDVEQLVHAFIFSILDTAMHFLLGSLARVFRDYCKQCCQDPDKSA